MKPDQVYWFHTSLGRTDEGAARSYLNCLDLADVNVHVGFLTKFPTREARRSHRRRTFLENPQPSAAVAVEKQRGATTSKNWRASVRAEPVDKQATVASSGEKTESI